MSSKANGIVEDAPTGTDATQFSDLGLSEELLAILEKQGWTTPTPIQSRSIPSILSGNDVIGVAQTGTGKTGAFLLPIIQKLGAPDPSNGPRALVLLPTRELALQVVKELDKTATPLGFRHTVVYGGTATGPQRAALREGVDILVATPGRLLDLCTQVLVQWGNLRFFVLDEADRMLDMGFIPDVESIMRRLPMGRQTLLFTATLEPKIRALAENYMLYPQEVTIGFNRGVADSVSQWVYPVERMQKQRLLLGLLEDLHIESGIVFCGTKSKTDELGKALRQKGYKVGILHSDRTQRHREQTLEQFRQGEVTFLVATDVASRGLDITGVTHVINFDVPTSPDDYIHRAGRTGRASAKGDAITLVSSQEEKYLMAIEKLLQKKLQRFALEGFNYKDGQPKNTIMGKPGDAQQGTARAAATEEAPEAAPALAGRTRKPRPPRNAEGKIAVLKKPADPIDSLLAEVVEETLEHLQEIEPQRPLAQRVAEELQQGAGDTQPGSHDAGGVGEGQGGRRRRRRRRGKRGAGNEGSPSHEEQATSANEDEAPPAPSPDKPAHSERVADHARSQQRPHRDKKKSGKMDRHHDYGDTPRARPLAAGPDGDADPRDRRPKSTRYGGNTWGF